MKEMTNTHNTYPTEQDTNNVHGESRGSVAVLERPTPPAEDIRREVGRYAVQPQIEVPERNSKNFSMSERDLAEQVRKMHLLDR